MTQYKLIKLEEGNVVVSDENRVINSLYLEEGFSGKNIFKWHVSQEKKYPNQKGKVIASDFPSELPSIDYNGLEEELGIVDLNQIFKKVYGYKKHKPYYDFGFKKAQSLNDKRFSLEDIKEAIKFFKTYQLTTNREVFDKDIHTYLKSLQQPTTFDIEVEMEVCNECINLEGQRFNPDCCHNYIPKITNNQIKITKVC